MEFFFDDSRIEAQFQEIVKKVRLLMNGEVHQEMRDFGLSYKKSLGASIVSLRQLAGNYPPNHLLAQKLWSRGFRETRILATLLEEPEKVTDQQLERWMEEMESAELVEQASMNLFCRLEGIMNRICQWNSSGDEKYRLAAVLVAGRLALVDPEIPEAEFVLFLDGLPQTDCDGYYKKALQRNLGKIGRRTPELREQLIVLVQQRMPLGKGWREVAGELTYELDCNFSEE